MKKYFYTILLFIFIVFDSAGQTNSGVIKGRVFNAKTNEGVPFATVQVWGTTIGAVTDFDGNFSYNGHKQQPGQS